MSTRSIIDSAPHYLGRLLEAAPAKVAIAGAVTLGGWLSSPGIHQAAIWLLIADWVSGTIKANVMHQVNSDAGVRGAVKSLIYLGLLGVGAMVAAASPVAGEVAQWVALAIIYTEAVSNLENLDALAKHFKVDVPILTQAIAVMRMRAEGAMQSGGTGPLTQPEKEATHAD